MRGLRGALSIRVNDGHSDRMVTDYCSGLRFTKVAPGGHLDLSFNMVLPRNTFTDLGPDDRVYVYDARTGKTVIEGYLDNPTPLDGPGGQSYAIHALGGMALASDETRALVYVDTSVDSFEKGTDSWASATVETGSQIAGTDTPGIQASFPSGSLAVATNAIASAGNYTLRRAGMELGAIHAVVLGGKTDLTWATEFVNTAGVITTTTLATGPTSFDLYAGTGSAPDIIPPGTDRFAFRLRRSGSSTNIADELTWLRLAGVTVLGRRMDRNGALLTGAAGMGTAFTVLASQVAEDLLGRVLTFCDPDTANIDATAFAIDQLAWPDGVKAADVFNQLSLFEPDYLWEILESDAAGKHRFNFRAWSATRLNLATDGGDVEARYEISTRDGFQRSGSDVDLCNRIVVSYTDAAGNLVSVPVTAASLGLVGIGLPVDALGDRVKDAEPVSLPDGFGSQDNAMRIGGQILTDKINPPVAGTAVVGRPIRDLLYGVDVMPWEIEPGYVARVRETGDVLRLTQVGYDDDSCSASLTLGRPVLTPDQRLARLERATAEILPIAG